MATPKVPLCRTLQRGMTGNDVIAHKRALSHAFPDLYPWWKRGFSPQYGTAFENAVKGAQLIMKVPVTGKINKVTHDALRQRRTARHRTEWAFDDYSIHLAEVYCANHKKKNKRQLAVEAGFYWYAHRYDMDAYSQMRAFILCKPPTVPKKWDCSAMVTNCHYAAGAPDPNGRGYDGQGYTGTLIGHGHKVKFGLLEPGDFIFYGFHRGASPAFPVGAPTHVAMYTGGGNVLSMGSYPMGFYKYNYRSDINCYVHYDI